jgi:hypothetical protein
MAQDKTVNAPAPAARKQANRPLTNLCRETPWFGTAIRAALNRPLQEREKVRVDEMLEALAVDLKGFSSELSELYVKTADFQRLLERIISRIADERHEEKRRIYVAFLADAVKSPCDPFEKQLRFLAALRELRLDQMRLMRALAAPPNLSHHRSLSPSQILEKRLPDVPHDRIAGLLTQMNDLGIINLAELKKINAASQRLDTCLTPIGRQFLRFMPAKK